ncbi:MAG: hypothetical protein ACTHNP_08135 [Solirubrobacterales bacterium]
MLIGPILQFPQTHSSIGPVTVSVLEPAFTIFVFRFDSGHSSNTPPPGSTNLKGTFVFRAKLSVVFAGHIDPQGVDVVEQKTVAEAVPVPPSTVSAPAATTARAITLRDLNMLSSSSIQRRKRQ